MTQIAASFVLLSGASVLLKDAAAHKWRRRLDTRQVLAINVPVMSCGRRTRWWTSTGKRCDGSGVAGGPGVGGAWRRRDAGQLGPGTFTVDGHVRGPGEEDPRGSTISLIFRIAGCRYWPSDFNDADRRARRVVIVSQSLARRMFPNQMR